MRRFLRSILLFVLPLAALRVGIEVAFRGVPNTYSDKVRLLREASPDLDGVVLGSSHAYLGVDPDELPGAALGLAHPSQSLRYDAAILDRVLAANPDLGYVVLVVSDFSLGRELHRTPGRWRVDFYRATWGFDPGPRPLRDGQLLLTQRVGLDRAVPIVWRWWTRGESPVQHGPGGHLAPTWEARSAPADEVAARHLRSARPEHERVNRAFLERMAAATAERGVVLALVRLPVTEPYAREMRGSRVARRTDEACAELAASHAHVVRIDLRDVELGAGAFYDADHLSPSGARAVTRRIAARLVELGLGG